MYFPDFGWIEFEPTSSRDPIIREERFGAEEETGEENPASPEDGAPDEPDTVPTLEPERLGDTLNPGETNTPERTPFSIPSVIR